MSEIARKKDTGEPGNGGQFGHTTKADSSLTLATTPTGSLLPADYQVDESWPQPQANDLDKVAEAVHAVAAGAVTNDAVAYALGVHQREGAYYADAAGYLGLLERKPGPDLTVLDTTGLGNQLNLADDPDRTAMLAQMVAHVPAVQSIRAGDDVAGLLEADGLSPSTAERRAATAASWAAQTADQDDLVQRMRVSSAETTQRAEQAQQIAEQQVREARQKNAEPVVKICPSCYMQLPTSGICSGFDCEAAAA